MKTLLFLVLLALVASLATATRGSISNNLFEEDVNDDVKEVLTEEEQDELPDIKEERRRNPCIRKKCHRGETCVLSKEVKAVCVCTPDCSFYNRNDNRYKACSNKNDTYATECDLNQDHCRCKRGEAECTRPGTKKITLEYFGACKEMKTCTDDEAGQFPERMKQWMFVVMEELDRRSEMGEYKDLLETAKQDSNHSMAVVWKFCDLDKDPQDRIVSRRELQHMVRSLKSLEHCLVPFLDTCDKDDDRKVSLVEWADCLGIDHEQISDKCHKIKNKKKNKKNK